MRRTICPYHGPVSPAYQAGSPIAGALAFATLAHNLSKGNPLLTVLFGGLGLWLGLEAGGRCPQCGAVLQIVEDINPLFG
jgi:hypothetical protein